MAYQAKQWTDQTRDPETHEIIIQGTPLNADNFNPMERELAALSAAMGEMSTAYMAKVRALEDRIASLERQMMGGV